MNMADANVSIRSRSDRDADNVRVLVAMADLPYAGAIQTFLKGDGFDVERCHDQKGVLRLVGRRRFDVILLDLELSAEGGVELVTFIRRRDPDAKLILLCDLSRIERAIDGIRRGAYFYLPTSVQPSDVGLIVNKAVRALEAETAAERFERSALEEMTAGSPAMKRVIEQVTKVAPTDSTVLLLGETGVGKEVMARTIHRLSPRQDMPFVAINCAALPEALLESEMFGHVKGAFTGAENNKTGLFAEADGGAVFLDEIGDMSLITQAKLLRVLQNGEIRPVGSNTVQHVDVRVIAATNRDLEKAVADMQFREDLYFRLNVIQIRVPPLRERMEAFPQLVRYFVTRANARYRKSVSDMDDEARALLQNYHYPGNIRELESIIAHAVIMCDDDVIRAKDLPDQVRAARRQRLALPNYITDSIPTIEEMEQDLIRMALDRLDNNQTEAAKRLGISRSTLWRKIKQYGISV